MYSHGLAAVPDHVQGLCLAVAERGLTNPRGVVQETIGAYSATYAREAGVVLSRAEKAQLRNYRYGTNSDE